MTTFKISIKTLTDTQWHENFIQQSYETVNDQPSSHERMQSQINIIRGHTTPSKGVARLSVGLSFIWRGRGLRTCERRRINH